MTTFAAGELRSIGSVMINTDTEGNKSILNADEFQRLMTVKAPPETGNDAANIDWARSRERLFQVCACVRVCVCVCVCVCSCVLSCSK